MSTAINYASGTLSQLRRHVNLERAAGRLETKPALPTFQIAHLLGLTTGAAGVAWCESKASCDTDLRIRALAIENEAHFLAFNYGRDE